jgi:hypothetical protein
LHTFVQLLQRALGGMARLEALLALLGGATVVVRLHCDRSHVAAATCFESKRNRRHFDCEESIMLGCARPSAGHDNFGRPLIDRNFILAPRLWRHASLVPLELPSDIHPQKGIVPTWRLIWPGIRLRICLYPRYYVHRVSRLTWCDLCPAFVHTQHLLGKCTSHADFTVAKDMIPYFCFAWHRNIDDRIGTSFSLCNSQRTAMSIVILISLTYV